MERSSTTTALLCVATTALGTIAWHMFAKAFEKPEVEEAQKELAQPTRAMFPEDITMEKMEADIDEFAMSLDHYQRSKFYALHHKFQEDVMIDTIPWIESQKIDFASYGNSCGYLSMGMAFIFDVINRMNKGEYHTDFDSCVEESLRFVVEATDRISKAHYALAARDLKLTLNQLMKMVIGRHYEMTNDGQMVKLNEEEIAI